VGSQLVADIYAAATTNPKPNPIILLHGQLSPGAARRYAPRRWQFDGRVSFRRQSGHLRQSMDPTIAVDLRPSVDGSTVRTSLVAGGG